MKYKYLTGIKPTGEPHLGNYIGSIHPALEYVNKEDTKCFYFIADVHALTTINNNIALKQFTYEIAASWLACGLDPNKVTFYKQSDIPEIFELFSIIINFAPKGLMNRAHAYKAITSSNVNNNREIDYGVNMGIFSYPILMTSDIMLFDIDYVPVGKDQKQHIEIARDIIDNFNLSYRARIKKPKEIISSKSSLLPGIDGRKMSKSYKNTIPLFASEEKLKKLINSVKTDSKAPNEAKDIDNTIYRIYREFADENETLSFQKKLESGISWADAKKELFNLLNNILAPMRESYNYYISNTKYIDEFLEAGAVEAREIAQKNLYEIKRISGLK